MPYKPAYAFFLEVHTYPYEYPVSVRQYSGLRI